MAAPVSEDVWSASDTNPDAIEAALRDLLRKRHAANESLAPARVLNLVVVVDRDWKGEIANRLERVGRYHASRTVLCSVEERREQLDATATVSYEDAPKGGIGVIREHVELDLGPTHLASLRTVVDPVLVSEIPTVLWSPHGHDEAVEALLSIVDVMLIDSDDGSEPAEAFDRSAALLDAAYVVDLAWLRTTPWRERMAASFDLPQRRVALHEISGLEVRHRATSTASALLLVGWLSSRLDWEQAPMKPAERSGLSGTARRQDGEVPIDLRSAEQDARGLGGVSVSCADGYELSLDRGRGGLDAVERGCDGSRRSWKVLGASRGEAGILGEGVRQALLRDPTYAPALDAARRFCPA
jgi:glucose-6-phosphate dehydrogenase assembly protein OpcA